MKKTFTVRDISVRNMAICAMLAALYAALCLALAPISYGFLNVRIAEAPSHGEPIVYYDDSSKGALAYTRLAKEVLKKCGQEVVMSNG